MDVLSGPTFPGFGALPEESELSLFYYGEGADGVTYSPRIAWALIGEITSDAKFMRPEVRLTDSTGERNVHVAWYHDPDEVSSFKPERLRVGTTLVVMHPRRKTFLDMTDGIRQESLKACWVFNAPFAAVRTEAAQLLGAADARALGGSRACFGCGGIDTPAARHSACSKCSLAVYCSQTCQRTRWAVHKRLCGDAERLLRLAALPRHKFDFSKHGFLSMESLPPYAPPTL